MHQALRTPASRSHDEVEDGSQLVRLYAPQLAPLRKSFEPVGIDIELNLVGIYVPFRRSRRGTSLIPPVYVLTLDPRREPFKTIDSRCVVGIEVISDGQDYVWNDLNSKCDEARRSARSICEVEFSLPWPASVLIRSGMQRKIERGVRCLQHRDRSNP